MSKATIAQVSGGRAPWAWGILGDDEVSGFKSKFHTSSSFATCPHEYPLASFYFEQTCTIRIPMDGDLMRHIYVLTELPAPVADLQPVPESVGPSERPTPGYDPIAAVIEEAKFEAQAQAQSQAQDTPSLAMKNDWLRYVGALGMSLLLRNNWGSADNFIHDIIHLTQAAVDRATSYAPRDSLAQLILTAYAQTQGAGDNTARDIYSAEEYLSVFPGFIKVLLYPALKLLDLQAALLDPDNMRSTSELINDWIDSAFNTTYSSLLSFFNDYLMKTTYSTLLQSIKSTSIPSVQSTSTATAGGWRLFLFQKLNDLGYYDSSRLYEASINYVSSISTVSSFYSTFLPPSLIRVLYEEYTGETATRSTSAQVVASLYSSLLQIIRKYMPGLTLSSSTLSTMVQTVVDVIFATAILCSLNEAPLDELKTKYTGYIPDDLPEPTPLETLLPTVFPLHAPDPRPLLPYVMFGMPSFLPGMPSRVRDTVNTLLSSLPITPASENRFIRDTGKILPFGRKLELPVSLGKIIDRNYSDPQLPGFLRAHITQQLGFCLPPIEVGKLVELVDAAVHTAASTKSKMITRISLIAEKFLVDHNLQGVTIITPQELRVALRAYRFPSYTPSKIPENIRQLAVFSEAFMEEMYCEYVHRRLLDKDLAIPREVVMGWWDALDATAEAEAMPPYDRQVLLSYHFEDTEDVEGRSPAAAGIIAGGFLQTAVPAVFYRRVMAHRVMTLSGFIEHARSNKNMTEFLFREWQRRCDGSKNDWAVVRTLRNPFPATVIEDHHLRICSDKLAGIYTDLKEYREDYLRRLSVPIDLGVAQSPGEDDVVLSSGFGWGGYEDVVALPPVGFLKPGQVHLYPLPYFFGKRTVIAWDGVADRPVLPTTGVRSLVVIPSRFISPSGEKYKGLPIIDPLDAGVMIVPPDASIASFDEATGRPVFTRRPYPSDSIHIRYEIIRSSVLARQMITAPPAGASSEREIVDSPGWVTDVGAQIIRSASILVDGQEIERITPSWFHLRTTLLEPRTNTRGSIEAMISPSSTSASPSLVYTPLFFWFTRDHHTAFPLVACSYADVTLQLTVASLRSLLRPFSIIPEGGGQQKIAARLLIDYICLGQDEREHFVRERNLTVSLISRTTRIRTPGSSVRLSLRGPVADIMLYFQDKALGDIEDPRSAKAIAQTIRLTINGRTDDAIRDASYYENVIPTQWYPGAGLPNVYVLPFAIYPGAVPPSGSLNFDAVSEASIEFTYHVSADSSTVDLIIVSRHHAIVHFASGHASALL